MTGQISGVARMSLAACANFPRGAVARLRAGAILRVPPDIAEKLHRDQATDLAYVMLGIAIAGMNTIALLFYDFLRSGITYSDCGIFCCQIATYGVLIREGSRWLRHPKPSGQAAKKTIDRIRFWLAPLGIFWALALIFLMRQSNTDQRALLYGVMVACMATPALVAPVSCAMVFWAPLTLGAVLSLILRRPVDPLALTCLLGFAALTAYCTVYLNKKLLERAIGAIRVAENAEVIKLLLRDFEENASDWLWETDHNLDLQHVSARLAQVAGKSPEQLTGRFPDSLLGELGHTDLSQSSPIAKLKQCIADRSPFRDLVVPVVVLAEERSWMLTGKPIFDKSGRFVGYHGVGSDVTAARRSQEQIAFLARHDSLTKLPNRVLFNEMLHLGCSQSEEHGLALLCLDLDDFKYVNDTMGHATGDGILIAVSERLRGCLREQDVAARLGGDEFAIILATEDIEEVTNVARRIIERVGRPYRFEGRLVEIGVSIGVAIAPKDGQTPTQLLKNADLALYRAKADGRSTWRLYDIGMDERMQDRRSLQTDLRQALARGEFHLNFQPIIDLTTKRIVAAEALLRWVHPERGALSPAEFVPMAVGAGLISAIGAWVLREACAVAVKWPEDVRVSVNLSPLQFRDEDLLSEVDAALAQTGLKASRLELEITETTVLETNNQTMEALFELHGRGIRIALDDFGTGYSSLSYLRRFPFNKIKIDRSFIRDLGQEKDDAPIILAIISLAENMNMVVTAEGVETEAQADFLITAGCDQAQGFLFYRPLSAEAVFEAIQLNHRAQPARVASAAE